MATTVMDSVIPHPEELVSHDSDTKKVSDQHRSRLRYLERWRELAIRPSPCDCDPEDLPLLKEPNDNVEELTRRCLKVRQSMNNNLPPHEQVLDGELQVDVSSIPGSGFGLFYRPNAPERSISKGETICYYGGHIHNFISAKSIEDKSYLMLVSGDMLVDPGPLQEIYARYINDPLNPRLINCRYEPQPERFRSAVVATRDIVSKEELFASYGDGYWANQATAGTVHNGTPC